MTTQPSTTPATKPQPVLLFGAITTFLTVVFGGLTTVAGLQDNKTLAIICGVGMLVTAGLNQAKDFYVKGLVTPAADVLAYLNDRRQVITGAAAKGDSGVPAVVEARPEAPLFDDEGYLPPAVGMISNPVVAEQLGLRKPGDED